MVPASATTASVAPKPELRGVSHQVAFFLAAVGTMALVRLAHPGVQRWCTAVFGGSLVVLFGVSALYHRVRWRPRALRWMRRLDHSAVLVAMAGGFTPLFALVPSTRGGHGALAVIWIGAGIGVLRAFVWPDAPPWIVVAVSVAVGWACAGQVVDRLASVGPWIIGSFVASGLLYTIGGGVLATKRPDPLPRLFGYHEVFHAFVVAGTATLFAHVAMLLRSAP
ncbi:MAG TPA: hemolysin III family protein [Polyangiaceae bacterium]|jgi:hemolysin III